MSNPETITQPANIEALKEVTNTRTAAEETPAPRKTATPASIKTEQFRDDLSGWVSAMYNELVEDIIGVIPDEDVCKLQNLYEQTLDIIKSAKVDESKLP